MILRNKTFEIY